MSSDIEPLRAYLQQWFPDFGYHRADDLFFGALQAEFPQADLLAQMKTFHAWCLDRPAAKAFNYRLTFRKMAVQFGPQARASLLNVPEAAAAPLPPLLTALHSIPSISKNQSDWRQDGNLVQQRRNSASEPKNLKITG
jgi:hypothetical protein